jgi:hypothetical protein
VAVELGVTAVAGAAFMIAYGLRASWRRTQVGRHLMAFAVIGVVESTLLLLLGVGVMPPPLVFVTTYGLVAAVTIQRLWVFVKIQLESSGRPGAAGTSSERKDHG